MKKQSPAETLQLTEQRAGRRALIYVNGYTAFVTAGCLDAIKILIRARLYGKTEWVSADKLNTKADLVSQYVYLWHREIGDRHHGGDTRLKGVVLFENDKHGNWRIAVDRDHISFETNLSWRMPKI